MFLLDSERKLLIIFLLLLVYLINEFLKTQIVQYCSTAPYFNTVVSQLLILMLVGTNRSIAISVGAVSY